MGFFHRGSGGKGVAPGDVCLTPPPPPGGPIPVPYVNMLQASDLVKGSVTVSVDGEPTALEDASEVSTSTGDEAGNQGGGVVTHKTKGKGSFKNWSHTVKVEGKGVACHGHMMAQNTASDPPNCIDAAAITTFKVFLGDKFGKPCPAYDSKNPKHRFGTTKAQEDAVKGKTCWECAAQQAAGLTPQTMDPQNPASFGKFLDNEKEFMTRRNGAYKTRDRQEMTADHQPPLCLAWKMGGCHLEPTDGDPTGFQKKMREPDMVKPHCRDHSNMQGSPAGAFARRVNVSSLM
ncbi:DUF4150 domain-containing protein [Roseateles amylovorans]|uniref:DUF4150 domain-containing protein n=1 Tax=Roseateles amylovorans TaxID=2978473 RepID=A0ABY6B6G9_9BURK|nr:DUF4150 domain-containing protein [Roseateles amylovorans]UXH80770.1 DUF4150 domain-containing protein [Roseateles amylovorans]